MRLTGVALFFLVSLFTMPLLAEREREMPVGVYLSWELANAYAELNGRPITEFLDGSLELCRQKGVNTLWVTNIDPGDLPMVQELCHKRAIRLVANTCEGKADSYYVDEAAPLRARLERMHAVATSTLDYWIISDEPEGRHVPNLAKYAGLLRQHDPGRGCALVVTLHMIDQIIGKVPLDMAAVDPYPFFGPDDPNGPHTAEASIAHFRRVGEHFVDVCRAAAVEPWMMPQSFAEIWGGYRYGEDGMLFAQPGSYLHWMTPTVEQIRWQVFESLRQGAQGIVFFQLFPTMLPAAGSQAMPDVPWKDVLLKKETAAGFGALLTIYGKSTPQFDELGRLYPILKRHSKLFREARPAPTVPKWFSNLPETVRWAAFQMHGDGEVFVVLVNDDFERPAMIGLSAEHLADLVTGRSQCTAIELPPGGGAILVQERR